MDLLLDLRRSYQSERCLVPWVMNMIFDDRKGFSAVLKSGGPAKPNRIVLFSGFIYFSCLNVDLCYLERILPTLDAAAGRIYPERAVSAGKWLDLRPSWYAIPYHILERLLVPGMDSLLLKVGFVQTAMQNTTVACALERYRRANGRLPEKLDTLVPQFLAAIPHDMVDGQPLRYRLDGTDGFVLYSIGWNRKDDGGQIAWTKPSSKNEKSQLDEKQGDWVWRSKPVAN